MGGSARYDGPFRKRRSGSRCAPGVATGGLWASPLVGHQRYTEDDRDDDTEVRKRLAGKPDE